MFTSAQYLLSDLYLPDGCLRNEWAAGSTETTSPDQSVIEASSFPSPDSPDIPSEQVMFFVARRFFPINFNISDFYRFMFGV